MAAEYEVNIKLNSKEIETQLGQIDRKIARIGKPKGGSSAKKAGIAGLLPSSTELKAAERGLIQLTAKTKAIQTIQDKFSERRVRALTRSNSLNEKELRLNRQLTNEARQRLRLLSQSGAKSFDATRPQGRQMSENINALVNAQEKRARLANKINEMEAKGLNVDKLRKQLGKATTEQSARRFASATKEFRLLEKTIRLEESKLKILRQQQKGFASSPIRGGANMPGSPLARQARRKRLEQVGLGAGFPLLFGGGAGSVIGGALGGLTGSFGAQIAFSAIGQQIDQFVAGVAAVGTALTSASGTVEMFREKNLFSSDAVKKHAFELEKQGRMQELATLLTKDLASQIGTNAVKSFQNLGGEVKEFLDSINHLFVAVGGFVAGPLAKLLDAINATLGGVSTNVEFQSLRDSLTGDAKAEFEAIIARERGVRELSNRERQRALMMEESVEPREGRLTTAVKERVLQDPAIAALRQTLNVTGQTTLDDTLGFKDRAAEEQKRIDQRIAALQIEAAKIAEISAFKDRIAAAEAVGDTMLVIRLQGQQRLKEIESSRLEKLIKATTQREQDAINLVAQAETTAAIAQTEREISAEYLKRQNLFDDTVADLEYQLAISQATSEAERERLRIEKKLQELKKKGLEDSQVAQIGQLMGQISAENSPLNKFIKQSVESLNNLEQHAVQVAQGIGNAIGNSLVSGMQNLITGAQSVKEVFADMLKSIADVLAKQAAQMIATYIAIGIARAFAGMGGEGADPNSAAVGDVLQQGGFTTGNMADQASAGTFTFAEGGYVSGPTRAVIGEGGESEYVIPESKMRESMARYSRGARGSAVIPEAGGTGTSGEGGGTAVAAPIDVRYTVERINSVDYVTADQFQRGMQQAASQGAKQGEQQTLKRLQMSGSTRKRLGM